MSNAPSSVDRPGAGRRAVAAWVLYDFANSPFTTLVVTFIYATYFTQAIAPDTVRGTALWSRAITVSALAVALLSPFLGALADRGGRRKPLLALFTGICVVATTALFFPRPGQIAAALGLFVVANVGYEMGQVFYNALLPVVAPAGRIGRVSGFGWGAGYFGGLLALAVALVTLVQPEQPWFGLSTDQGQNVRATNVLAAIWLAFFSIPIFVWVRSEPPTGKASPRPWRDAIVELRSTLGEVRRYRQTARFLVARLIYNDGLITIFAFGGIYAAAEFGFTFAEILVFGIVINVAAGTGAVAMGYFDDVAGGKRTVQISLLGLSAATLLAVAAPSREGLWVAGLAIGLFAGPNQSASRSLMGRFTPPDKESEFFGFFAFSGKATAFAGPLLFGLLTEWTGSHRAGVAAVLAFFAVGSGLLGRVDEAEGIRASGRGGLAPARAHTPDATS